MRDPGNEVEVIVANSTYSYIPLFVVKWCFRLSPGLILFGQVHTWCLSAVPEHDSRWALM